MVNKIKLIAILSCFCVYCMTSLMVNEGFAAPPSKKKVDFVAFYSQVLLKEGVTDLSYENLVATLNTTENENIKYAIILLFAEKGLLQSVPVIAPFLNDHNANTRIAAARALSMLGDSRGVPVLAKICEQKPDDLKCLDAAGALAANGDMKSYAYLKNFTRSRYEGYRNVALNHLKTLAEKVDPVSSDQSKAVVDDMMAVMSEDKDVSVKEHAIWLLENIKIKNKKHVINKFKEVKNTLKGDVKNKKVVDKLDSAIEGLESQEKQ